MNPLGSIRRMGWACCVAALLVQPLIAEESASDSFRAILELAEIGPDRLAQIGERPNYSDEDWQLLLQVANRLQQFPDPNPSARYATIFSRKGFSRKGIASPLGWITRVRGQIVSVEKLPLPASVMKFQNWKAVYQCQLRFQAGEGLGAHEATILTTQIPKSWHTKKTFQEPVRVRGVVIQFSAETRQPLILTNHVAWYPVNDVPTGQLLLARHGMDVALLDEVRHRQPFVKPEISREGEAFYAALIALSQVDQQELVRLASENVTHMAAAWRARQPELRRNHQMLEEQLTNETEASQRERLQREVKAARDRRGLAAAVLELSESKRSSVAPLFLQPHEEVGELVRFEGVARRAVRIAVTDQPALNAYYEIEIFTSDSQNLPIVCCVNQLPAGFPTGDEIREPVQIAGVFFKNWRYRSRKLADNPGETGRQRRLYTPVLLGKTPIWLNKSAASRDNPWALWGGLAFLGLLLTMWISMSWLARRDRTARAALRRDEIIDL